MENKYNQLFAAKDRIINNLQTRNGLLERRLRVAELRIKEHEQLIEEAEQYSRRHSLHLNGLEVKYNESADDVLNLVEKEIKHMNLSIQDFEVDRAHRNGRSYTDKDGNKKQTVLVTFIRLECVEQIL